jgi:hypothetical protein
VETRLKTDMFRDIKDSQGHVPRCLCCPPLS